MIRVLQRIFYNVSLLLVLTSESTHSSDHHLGDSLTSQQATQDLFSDLDINGNGKVSESELFEFVQETGGDSLDESEEVQNAVTAVMSVMDGNRDKVLKKDDLSKYMKSLASLLPLDEVARWVAHAQQMPPEVVQSFVDNGITGYDFPELLQRDGLLLERELGIRRQTLRRRLLRGMRMKLLGMGNHPAAPELLALSTLPPTESSTVMPSHIQSPAKLATTLQPEDQAHDEGGSCEAPTVLIQWGSGGGAEHDQSSQLPDFLTPPSRENNNGMDFPVHKYQLYREGGGDHRGGGSQRPEANTLEGKDVLIYEGMEMFFKDRPPPAASHTYTYRLVAWNVIGRSEYTVFEHRVPPLPPRCAVHALSLSPLLDSNSQILAGGGRASQEVVLGNRQTHRDNSLSQDQDQEVASRVNKITPVPSPSAEAIPASSIATQLLDAFFNIFSFVGYTIYFLKVAFVSLSFVLSVMFTVLRVKSLLVFKQAIARQGSQEVTEVRGGGGLVARVLGAASALEPLLTWLQHRVLAPALCLIAPPLARRLDAVACAEPPSSWQPLATYLLGALRSVLQLVVNEAEEVEKEKEEEKFDSAINASGTVGTTLTQRKVSGISSVADSRVMRGVSRTASGISTESSSSADTGPSYSQCSICFVKVTNKIFSTYVKNKQKRHHCCRCGNVFCRNCGTVDHSDFMQCQVPGRCVCRQCGGGAATVKIHRENLAKPPMTSHRRSCSDGSGDISAILSSIHPGSGSFGSSATRSRSNSPSHATLIETALETEGSARVDSRGSNRHVSSSLASAIHLSSEQQQQVGKPPLHSSSGDKKRNVRNDTTENDTHVLKRSSKIKFTSFFGIRNRTPSPPPKARANNCVPLSAGGANGNDDKEDGSEDLPMS